MSISVDYTDILHYVARKQWNVSLNEQEYEGILAKEIGDLLVATTDFNADQELNLLFAIVWNELKNAWNSNIPFLTDKQTRCHILRYLWLQDALKIKSTTKFIFEMLRSPNITLSFRIGGAFSIRSDLKYGQIVIRIELRNDNALKTYEMFRNRELAINELAINELAINELAIDELAIDELAIDKLVETPCDPGRARNYSLHNVEEYKSLPETSSKELLREFHTCVEKDLPEDLSSDSYGKFLEDVVREIDSAHPLGGIDTEHDNRTPDAKSAIEDLHKILALIYMLLEPQSNRELAYFFNATDVRNVDPGKSMHAQEDGGCFAMMGKKDRIDYSKYHILAALSLTKLSSVQKSFRRHSERKHAHRSAIAAIMGRNMSHNIGSHVLWHFSQQLDPDGE